jgi:histidyl-tRNA synthetase
VRREQNPLRTFDCKSEACQQVLTAAPRARDSLCPDCAGHFQAVLDGLKQRGVDYVFNDRLVRGLDYYCRTAFEYIAGSIGAQDSLGGGGRYDYLVEDFGGPATPAIGFALGEERALLAAGPSAAADTRRLVFVIAMSDNERAAAIALLQELRQAGIAARMDYEHRKPKSQFHAADSAGAQYCVILGSDELAQGQVSLKDLKTGEQQKLTRAELMARLTTDR